MPSSRTWYSQPDARSVSVSASWTETTLRRPEEVFMFDWNEFSKTRHRVVRGTMVVAFRAKVSLSVKYEA